ncbi:MAG: LuxR family transcriptional regulator [Hyphomicrobiales bacterium]
MRPFDILDLNTTPFPTFEAASAQLLSLRADLEVENLSYWHIGPHGANLGDAVWISTYPREYRDLYLKLELQKGDPAFALSFERLLPTDWDDIHSLAQSRPILEAAHDFHISPRGISFPIRDEATGDSLFNLNIRCTDAEWHARRNGLARDFFAVAHVFHMMVRRILRGSAGEEEAPTLSRREIAVMRCAARGLTAKQTALELGIAENSVRIFIQFAKRRLNAKTKAQAVAIALSSGLLKSD